MAVTPAEVRRIAELARLNLTADEVATFTEQLNGILTHVEELRAVDGGAEDGARDSSWLAAAIGIGPTETDADAAAPAHANGPSEHVARARSDVPGADPLLRSPADIAPAWQAGFFTVPRLAAMDDRDADDNHEDES